MKQIINWEEVSEKKKPAHLDSKSSDKEFEPEIDLNFNIKRKIMIKKSDYCNTLKKTSNKSKTAIKAPPPVPLPEKPQMSPDNITRQHTPQLSKQPTFLPSVKDSNKDRANFLKKITSQKDEEKKREIFMKIKQKKQDKQKFKGEKHNSEKKSFSSISTRTVEQDELSSLFTPSKNFVTYKGKSRYSSSLAICQW